MANPGDAPTVPGGEQPPQVKESSADREEQLREITIGVDEFVEGFNPHLIADTSPLTDLVSALTLPSVFVPDPDNPDVLVVNEDLMESVTATTEQEEVAQGEPATRVRYVLRQGAQWSDGTPISGEDFRYLHSRLTSSPGTAQTATYDLVRSVDISAGGRQIDVEFSEPVAGWDTLFRNLLPSHLLKSSTDGFNEVLDEMIPAAGARYKVQSIDVGRNIVRLVRNDRFWGKQPAHTENVVIRAVRSAVNGAEQLRTDQVQAVQVRPQQTTALTYGLVPTAQEFTWDTARELTLTANMASATLQGAAERREILNRINVAQVRAVATGRSAGGDEPPTQTTSTNASGPSGASGVSGAVDGGYGVDGVDGVDEDTPLRIGVMTGDAQAVAAAHAIADQLTASGVPTVVDTAQPLELSRSLLPYGLVDFVVAWNESVDSMTQARNRYLCPSASVPSLEPKGQQARREAPAESATRNSAAENRAAEDPAAESEFDSESAAEAKELVAPRSVARTGNLSGLCDPDLDVLLAASAAEMPAAAADLVEGHAIELPLVTDRILTVVGAGVTEATEADPRAWPSAPYIGKLMTIPTWQRVLPTGGGNATAAEDEEQQGTEATNSEDQGAERQGTANQGTEPKNSEEAGSAQKRAE